MKNQEAFKKRQRKRNLRRGKHDGRNTR